MKTLILAAAWVVTSLVATGQIITNNTSSQRSAVWVTYASGAKLAFPPAADTDAARGDAFETAFASARATTGAERITLYPNSFAADKTAVTTGGIPVQFEMEAGMVIELNGARIYHANSSPQNAACLFYAVLVDDWAIYGPGKIEGAAAASSGTNEIAVNTASCRRWRMEGITFWNWRNTALQLNSSTYSGSYSGWKFSTGHVSNCNFDYNNIAVAQYANNEYVAFDNCTFNLNLTAFDCMGGNTKFVGCEMNANTNYGMRLRGTSGNNYGHGEYVGGAINHNAAFAVDAAAGMVNGWQFTGVNLAADSVTTNKIQSLGVGLNFVGCTMESPFFASATAAGTNMMSNCFIAGTYTVTTDLSTAERLKWKFSNNYTSSGAWSGNDLQTYTYADNTAALAGGLVAGETYKDASGNLKIVY